MRQFLLLAALAALCTTASAAPRGLTGEDLATLDRISDLRLSPDGRQLVYSLRETDLGADRGRSDLWLLPLQGDAAARRLTTSEENDTAAEWSADGQGIYFLSSRSGSSQVWYLALSGGEARQVTQIRGGCRQLPIVVAR